MKVQQQTVNLKSHNFASTF